MSYSINKRKRTTGEIYWRVCWCTQENGKRHWQHIPAAQLIQHGFLPSMTIEEAKARASQLNSQAHLERAKVSALRRLHTVNTVKSAYLPEPLLQEFLKYLQQEIAIGPNSAAKWKKAQSHWLYAQRLVARLELEPRDWYDSKRRIYGYFAEQETSREYVTKILRVLNLWGAFQARKTGQSFIQVPAPTGYDREMINDAFEDSTKKKKTSAPLTPEMLETARSKFSEAQYRWLYLSVWLGLRPKEVDRIATAKVKHEQGVDVLWVYQTKIGGVTRDKRVKPIPLVYPEQRLCLGFIAQGIHKPIVSTMQKYLGPGVNLYGGRKGFVDLMLSKGQTLEDISVWLGHASIERTWKSYKQKQKVSFRKVG